MITTLCDTRNPLEGLSLITGHRDAWEGSEREVTLSCFSATQVGELVRRSVMEGHSMLQWRILSFSLLPF